MEANAFYFMTQFWRENERRTFSAKETQLYFFLLAEFNRLHRQNPFACSTQRIINCLGISRHTLCRLREALQARGLIRYEEGRNLSAMPRYTLLTASQCANTDTQDGTQDGTQNLQCANTDTQDGTQNLQRANTDTQDGTQDGTQNLQCANADTQDGTQDGTIIKRDKRNNSTIINEELLSLEELHARLLGDAEWLARVGSLAAKHGIDAGEKRMRERLDEFFLYLQTCGTQTKTLGDAQRHFVNWLVKRAASTSDRRQLPPRCVGVKLTDNSPDKFKDVKGW